MEDKPLTHYQKYKNTINQEKYKQQRRENSKKFYKENPDYIKNYIKQERENAKKYLELLKVIEKQ